MPQLTAPQTFASDIGTVIARAQQSAASQSAQILAAANNIARGRERAGQAAADSMFRERLHQFQREQFAEKARVANERLALAQNADQRAQDLAPIQLSGAKLDNELKQTAIDQAPLRNALLGTQVAGGNIRNAAGIIELAALPQRLETAQETAEARGGILGNQAKLSDAETPLAIANAYKLEDTFNTQERALADLNALTQLGKGHSNMLQGQATLERLNKDSRVEISLKDDLTEIYNNAVDRFRLDPKLKIVPKDQQAFEGLVPSSQTIQTDANGKSVSSTTFRAPESTALKTSDITGRINQLKTVSEEMKKSFLRKHDSVDKGITALNKRLADADTPEAKRTIEAQLRELRSERTALEGDLQDFEKEAAGSMDSIRKTGFGNISNQDGFGGASTLLGDPAGVISILRK